MQLSKRLSETAFERSSPTLYATGDRTSPLNTPLTQLKQNTILLVDQSGQPQGLDFLVIAPEAGFYHISLEPTKFIGGLFSTRRVYINDEIPFKEANNARFYYSSDWELLLLVMKKKSICFILKKEKT